MKFVFYIGIEVLIDQMVKVFKCWNILIFRIDLREKNIFEFVYQGLIWRWHRIECFLESAKCDCPLNGKVDKSNMQNFQLVLLC